MLNLAALFITLTALCMWFNQRVLRLPPTIGVMAIALALSVMVIALDHVTVTTVFAQTAEAWLARIDFNVLLMDGMLSLLLFAGALHVDLSKLHHYRVSIGLLATLGVLVSTGVIGTAAWWLFQQAGMGVPYAFCLVFGALISPTDPIAVLGIMRNAGAPVDMEIRIVGESLFNDGVAVVVFTALLGVATASGGESIDIGHLALLFIEEAGGGILLGLALGGLVHRLMNSINQYQVEVMLSLALVVGGYALAQALHLSGPIAMVVAGLIIGNMARIGAMSESTRRYLDAFWELIDEILNAVLFVLIGLELVLMPLSIEVVGIALALVVVILVSRFLIIGVPLRLLSGRRHFRAGTTRVLTWGGLRGGISVALALSLPDGEIRNTLVVTTYVIVLFSILVQGLTIGRLVRHVLKAPS